MPKTPTFIFVKKIKKKEKKLKFKNMFPYIEKKNAHTQNRNLV